MPSTQELYTRVIALAESLDLATEDTSVLYNFILREGRDCYKLGTSDGVAWAQRQLTIAQ